MTSVVWPDLPRYPPILCFNWSLKLWQMEQADTAAAFLFLLTMKSLCLIFCNSLAWPGLLWWEQLEVNTGTQTVGNWILKNPPVVVRVAALVFTAASWDCLLMPFINPGPARRLFMPDLSDILLLYFHLTAPALELDITLEYISIYLGFCLNATHTPWSWEELKRHKIRVSSKGCP